MLVPQIENGEALIIPTKSDIDVFVSQKKYLIKYGI
jgi:hypothetical protein